MADRRKSLRRLVPLSAYPLLAPFMRARRRRHMRRVAEDERGQEIPGVPPIELRYRVQPRSPGAEAYLAGARTARERLEAALARGGHELSDFTSALDFGCGCGRILSTFETRPDGLTLHGTDVDDELVAWCRANIPFAEFKVNRHEPPLDYPDDNFDLVWTISVFTHLNETDQFGWLEELRRVVRPGGIVLASIAGEGVWGGLPPWTVKRIRSLGFVDSIVWDSPLPTWYQNTYHTEEYVRDQWGKYFEVVDILESAVHRQDIIVLRNRD